MYRMTSVQLLQVRHTKRRISEMSSHAKFRAHVLSTSVFVSLVLLFFSITPVQNAPAQASFFDSLRTNSCISAQRIVNSPGVINVEDEVNSCCSHGTTVCELLKLSFEKLCDDFPVTVVEQSEISSLSELVVDCKQLISAVEHNPFVVEDTKFQYFIKNSSECNNTCGTFRSVCALLFIVNTNFPIEHQKNVSAPEKATLAPSEPAPSKRNGDDFAEKSRENNGTSQKIASESLHKLSSGETGSDHGKYKESAAPLLAHDTKPTVTNRVDSSKHNLTKDSAVNKNGISTASGQVLSASSADKMVTLDEAKHSSQKQDGSVAEQSKSSTAAAVAKSSSVDKSSDFEDDPGQESHNQYNEAEGNNIASPDAKEGSKNFETPNFDTEVTYERNQRLNSLQTDDGNQFNPSNDQPPGSGYFGYFIMFMAICAIFFILVQNKKRIFAMLIEGRKPRPARRRSSVGSYRKLENNFD